MKKHYSREKIDKTSSTLQSKGESLVKQGDYQGAKKYFGQATALWERVSSHTHWKIAKRKEKKVDQLEKDYDELSNAPLEGRAFDADRKRDRDKVNLRDRIIKNSKEARQLYGKASAELYETTKKKALTERLMSKSREMEKKEKFYAGENKDAKKRILHAGHWQDTFGTDWRKTYGKGAAIGLLLISSIFLSSLNITGFTINNNQNPTIFNALGILSFIGGLLILLISFKKTQ